MAGTSTPTFTWDAERAARMRELRAMNRDDMTREERQEREALCYAHTNWLLQEQRLSALRRQGRA